MQRAYCELDRQFFEQPTFDSSDLNSLEYRGKRVGWAQLLDNFVSVIVAPANFGKTTEMSHKAAAMRSVGLDAVFLPLRSLIDVQSVEEALDVECKKSYLRWRSSINSNLTLFIDSLDEVAAYKNEHIQYLLNRVLKEIGAERDRVRWVISTRPAILDDALLKKMASILEFPLPGLQREESDSLDDVSKDTAIVFERASDAKDFMLYKMAPLDSQQGALYLANTRPNLEAAALIGLARERGLGGFCRSPGGLDILARIELLKSPPESLTEIYERVFHELTNNIASDSRFIDAGRPAQDLLIDILEKIASATEVCRRPNIELPDANSDPDDAILSARRIATPKLTEQVLQILLSTQSFIDAQLNQVKLYPFELPPYLAARRLSVRVNSAEEALRLISVFSWSSQTGEKGVYKEYFLLMGWLATLNRHCRAVLIESDPQVLAFFGDMRNASVPTQDARRALRESIRRLVELGDEPGRGLYYLTSENYWAAAPERLAADIESLYRTYRGHAEASSILLQLAAAGKISQLRKHLLAVHQNDYAKILSDRDEVDYLISIGIEADAKGLVAALGTIENLTESMVRAVLPTLGWKYFSAYDVINIIRRLTSKDQGYFGLAFIFEQDDFLNQATEEHRFKICRGLVIPLIRNKDYFASQELRANDDYINIVKTVFSAMVRRATERTADKVCKLALLLERAIFRGYLHHFESAEIQPSFGENQYIRRAYLRMLLVQKALEDSLKWLLVLGHVGIAKFDDEDRKASFSETDRIAAGNQEEKWASAAADIKVSEPPRTKTQQKDFLEEKKAEFKAKSGDVRSAKDTSLLIWASRLMMLGNSLTRYGEVDFSKFEKNAGAEIAEDVLAGMSKLWRTQYPLFNENSPNSTHYITIAGLQGLCIEYDRGLSLDTLTPTEVKHALSYAKFEMNNYPKWFWPLVEAHQQIALEELFLVAKGHPNGPLSQAHAERLFSLLKDAPENFRRMLLPEAWSYVKNGSNINTSISERVLSLMSELGLLPKPREYEALVWRKLKVIDFPSDLGHIMNAMQEDAVMWASQWLMLYPKQFHAAMMSLGRRDADYARLLLGRILSYFGHGYGASLSRVTQAGVDGIQALEFLRTVAKWAIPEEGDEERVSGRAYSPGSRDHAARARDKILDVLASANSQAAYVALFNLSEKASGNELRYIRKLMFEMRERELSREPVRQIEYSKFEENFQPTVTGSVAFSMAVHTDLETVKYDIEKGEHSLRSFFSEVDFRRLNVKGSEGEKAALALEEHFQILLASEMSHHAKGRYSVGLEVQTAEKKRRDVQCSKQSWRASIEVKMSERWSLRQYLEALDKQLVGQYMQNYDANTGFLVIVLQKERVWKALDGRTELDFEEVIRVLQERALELFEKNPEYYLRVIGINAIPPSDFRKRPRKKAS
ncbi:hypothetical protein [Herbaspirillum huttiense]|uniref:Uncharacterized protein n=2 Tax=Herbaspirillum huttiense TaxID=863372 RepID=A0AAJ2LS91_9BURK|nr:hypothetical protein [Herbaspirillum huttiense]MDR9837647.1 hypothetical protein [Herbaspirillum huttiense]